MVRSKAWTAPEDKIVQDADNACRLGKNEQALARQLKRTGKAIYLRARFLRLPPIERDRFLRAKYEAFQVSSKSTINQIKIKDHNKIKNTRNNKIRHDAAMAYKEQLAREQGHNPPSVTWHTTNTNTKLSSPEAQAAMATPGVGVHVYAYSAGGRMKENAGHATTNHRWVHAKTGANIKLHEYNAHVLCTVGLGEWGDHISWRRAERSGTDLFLRKHPRCINRNNGGGGGSESTCAAAIEFLHPQFFIDFSEVVVV